MLTTLYMSCGFFLYYFVFFFFKQKTAYEMRISDWSSDVCSSDLGGARHQEWSCHRRYGNHDQRGRGRAGAGAEGDIGMSMLKEGRPTRPDISEDRKRVG